MGNFAFWGSLPILNDEPTCPNGKGLFKVIRTNCRCDLLRKGRKDNKNISEMQIFGARTAMSTH